MSRDLNKEDIIQHKKKAIRSLNSLLEALINSNQTDRLKKADLLSYWLESFSQYIRYENSFNPQRLLSYKRGDIIRVNLGFRVGAEFGGLHYAVVLDKNNRHNSNTVTIIPLSSSKKCPEEVHERDLFLGSELYNLVSAKYEQQLTQVNDKIEEISSLIDLLISLSEDSYSIKIEDALETMRIQQNNLFEDLNTLKKHEREISRMKEGSIAKVEQITTISKMRIYVPKKSTDFLAGIRFSQNAMSRINAKIKELYVFDE